MANLLERFVHRIEFDSYEDFYKNFSITVPKNFNFAYDVVDVYATEQPDKRALIWVDDHGHERTLTFGDLKYLSDKAANFFLSRGIRKGDHVMLILRGHYSFWYCLLGLHKIGAITTPATHMLTSKDLVYRIDKGDIRMIVASNWAQLPDHVDDAEGKVEVEKPLKVLQNGTRPGWLSLEEEIEKISPDFTRPVGEANTCNEDISLALFSSGTSSYPKMVQHDFLYPLAHIVTAKYWQRCIDDGLHYTVADTGWGKVL
ncbi:MAG: AMP-binding protein, partial [Deltaproteobacteria bacterium]|nr:AMP-binding protein [Deltaproteobacteria bacterium]